MSEKGKKGGKQAFEHWFSIVATLRLTFYHLAAVVGLSQMKLTNQKTERFDKRFCQ
jgi:hypothetical protein